MTREVAHGGREVRCGEYLFVHAVEAAEGMWVPENGSLEWQEPAEENAPIEIAIRETAEGRFIPGLAAAVTMIGPDGGIGPHGMPMLWYPYLLQVREAIFDTVRAKTELTDPPLLPDLCARAFGPTFSRCPGSSRCPNHA